MKYVYLKPELDNLSQGERIAFVRQFRRLTQDNASEKLGLTGEAKRRTMTRYERGDRTPKKDRLLEIAESFNREFRFEEDFVYEENDDNSVVKQIESFCQKQDYKLCDGWKVLVARRYIQRNKKPSEELINKWKELFDKIK